MAVVKALDVNGAGNSHLLTGISASTDEAVEHAQLLQESANKRNEHIYFYVGENGRTEVDMNSPLLCGLCKERLSF